MDCQPSHGSAAESRFQQRALPWVPGADYSYEVHVRDAEHVEPPVFWRDSNARIVYPAAPNAEGFEERLGPSEVCTILLDELNIKSILGMPRHAALGVKVTAHEGGRLADCPHLIG